jgi:hypothetical protein
MTKVLFLDFDGVLLPYAGCKPTKVPSAGAISNLNAIVQLTGASVVVISNWRIGRTVQQLTSLLKGWGYRGMVLDKSGESEDDDRGAEVGYWLARNEVGAFVVVDDEPTDLGEFSKQLVMPDPDVGLQWHDVQLAVSILIKDP